MKERYEFYWLRLVDQRPKLISAVGSIDYTLSLLVVTSHLQRSKLSTNQWAIYII